MTKRLTLFVLSLFVSLNFINCEKDNGVTEPNPIAKSDLNYPMYVLTYDGSNDKSIVYKMSVPDEIVLDSGVFDFRAFSIYLTPDETHLILTEGFLGTQSLLVEIDDFSVVTTTDWIGWLDFDKSRNIGFRLWTNGCFRFDPTTMTLQDSILIPEPDLALDTVVGLAYLTSQHDGYESIAIVVDYLTMTVVDTLLVSPDPLEIYALHVDKIRDRIIFNTCMACGDIGAYNLSTDSLNSLTTFATAYPRLLPNDEKNLTWVYGNVLDHFNQFDLIGYLYAYNSDSWVRVFEYRAFGHDSLGLGRHGISDLANTPEGENIYMSCNSNDPGIIKVDAQAGFESIIDQPFEVVGLEIGTKPF